MGSTRKSSYLNFLKVLPLLFILGCSYSVTYKQQLPLNNWGLYNPKNTSHIDAIEAWKIEKGSKKVKVAIIDTGLDSTHPDLKDKVYRDKSQHYGYDFTKNEYDPEDDNGHGTHIAGIITSIANVSIISGKYFIESNTGVMNLKATVRAIEWAVNNKVHIINYSGGGPEFAEEEYVALKKAEAAGILVVVAAGNERQDSDLPENYYYPSAYRLTNIISVAATDINNKLIRSSNWGKTKVDVAAPGENILSTLPKTRYGYMTGTSQATAFVTGIASLLLSHDLTLTPAKIKEIVRNSVDVIPELKDKTASGGRVNANKALLLLNSTMNLDKVRK